MISIQAKAFTATGWFFSRKHEAFNTTGSAAWAS
jgi:hypothetical protein